LTIAPVFAVMTPSVGDIPDGIGRTLVPVAHVRRDYPSLIHGTSSHSVGE
jgi:hypothetical protein